MSQKANDKKPIRTCIMCRKKMEKKQLLRHVIKNNIMTADLKQIELGRGFYICKNPACQMKKQNPKLGKRFFKGGVN